jgi:uncharacterized metal-binding protein YceD (DUF177 family)
VTVSRLHNGERQFDIVASAAERKALAKRYRILEVTRLEASLTLRRLSGANVVRLTGTVVADVVQACVVTLEPVPEHIEETFTMSFAEAVDVDATEIDVGFESEDPPEALVDDIIDIGEAAAEHVALALDPFPRAPGAVFIPPDEETPLPATDARRETRDNPFAALTAWKKS